jgi:hypothetical protein
MTTTYDPTQLAANTTYQVRLYLGDNDTTSFQMQDEEIAWAILERGNVWGATSLCAYALAAKYSRLTSISADGVSQALQQKADAYSKLAVVYAKKEAVYRAVPYVGGVSISDMRTTISDTDRVPDIFRLGMNDNPPNDGVDPVNSPAIGADDPVFDGGL